MDSLRQIIELQKKMDKLVNPTYRKTAETIKKLDLIGKNLAYSPLGNQQSSWFKNYFNSTPVWKKHFFPTYAPFASIFLNADYDLNDLLETENEEVYVNEAAQIKGIIEDIYKDNKKLLEVSPRKFEEIIAELLLMKKFKVELTKQTRDNGYDIIAIQDVGGFENKYLIECKRYRTKPVGIEVIRSFSDVILSENANKGIICTTSYFTKEAIRKKSLKPYLLDFKDRIDIIDWVNEYFKTVIKSY